MKKTLIALMTLASICSASSITISAKSDSPTTSTSAYAIQFNITSAFENQRAIWSSENPAITEFPSSISVETITIKVDQTANRYGYILDDANKLVGYSTNQSSCSPAVDLSFTFNDVVLNSTTTYRLYLTTESQSGYNGQGVTIGTVLDAPRYNSLYIKAGTLSDADIQSGANSLDSSSWGLLNKNVSGTPIMTISARAIPEPAAATLSLLALAGLCVRRRR